MPEPNDLHQAMSAFRGKHYRTAYELFEKFSIDPGQRPASYVAAEWMRLCCAYKTGVVGDLLPELVALAERHENGREREWLLVKFACDVYVFLEDRQISESLIGYVRKLQTDDESSTLLLFLEACWRLEDDTAGASWEETVRRISDLDSFDPIVEHFCVLLVSKIPGARPALREALAGRDDATDPAWLVHQRSTLRRTLSI